MSRRRFTFHGWFDVDTLAAADGVEQSLRDVLDTYCANSDMGVEYVGKVDVVDEDDEAPLVVPRDELGGTPNTGLRLVDTANPPRLPAKRRWWHPSKGDPA